MGIPSQVHIQEPLITRMLEQGRRLRLHQHILVQMLNNYSITDHPSTTADVAKLKL